MIEPQEMTTNSFQEALPLLLRAAELVAEPEHWTQGAFARDSAGNELSPDSPAASAFCPVGAIIRAEHELHGTGVAFVPERLEGNRSIGGPKRAQTAMALVAGLLLIIYVRLRAGDPTEEQAEKGQRRNSQTRTPADVIAVLVNDQPEMTHRSVALALSEAVEVTREVLRVRRRRRKKDLTEGDAE